jgi:hypothetical protein
VSEHEPPAHVLTTDPEMLTPTFSCACDKPANSQAAVGSPTSKFSPPFDKPANPLQLHDALFPLSHVLLPGLQTLNSRMLRYSHLSLASDRPANPILHTSPMYINYIIANICHIHTQLYDPQQLFPPSLSPPLDRPANPDPKYIQGIS